MPGLTNHPEADLRLDDAIARAAAFLIRQQEADGAWRDFQCAPGRSEAWVTAYVGMRLLPLDAAHGLHDSLARAIDLLRRVATPSGGWGYNRTCGIDADSTAQTILFLRAAGANVALQSYATLARFQMDDGSFRTYAPDLFPHGWSSGHPDVTAVALQALAAVLHADHGMLRRGCASLREHLSGPSCEQSYWWPSRTYLRRELLKLRMVVAGSPLVQANDWIPSLPGCFETALALYCEVLAVQGGSRASGQRQAGTAALLVNLLASQLSDGSWPSLPMLRISSPEAMTVQQANTLAAPLVADDRRLFTTATCLESLTSARHGKLCQSSL